MKKLLISILSLSVLAGSYAALASVVTSVNTRPNFCPNCGFRFYNWNVTSRADTVNKVIEYTAVCPKCAHVDTLKLIVNDSANEKDTADK